MKLTKEKLIELILEEWDRESLQALRKNRPGYAFTMPREIRDDEPEYDEYGDPIYDENDDLVFPKKEATPEILRARAADMSRGGIEPKNVRKLRDLSGQDLEDVQSFELADMLMDDEKLQGRYSPRLSAIIASKKKLQDAYQEIRGSRELRTYKFELANRMMHDGSMDYRDNFYEADTDLSNFEKRIAKKYGLTEKEIEKLDDMLRTDKESY